MVTRRVIVISTSVCVCVFLCLSVCLSARISPESQARSLAILCMLHFAEAVSSSGAVTKSQEKGQFRGFSTPLTMHCMGRIEAYISLRIPIWLKLSYLPRSRTEFNFPIVRGTILMNYYEITR